MSYPASPNKRAHVLRILTEAADAGAHCPPTAAIADAAGYQSACGVTKAIRILESTGIIESRVHNNFRVVRIVATGATTATERPAHLRLGRKTGPRMEPQPKPDAGAVKPRKAVRPGGWGFNKPTAIPGPGADVLSQAVAVLQRDYAPVCRARTVDGNAPRDWWLVGRRQMDGAELLDLAKRKGFDPEAWRVIPLPTALEARP